MLNVREVNRFRVRYIIKMNAMMMSTIVFMDIYLSHGLPIKGFVFGMAFIFLGEFARSVYQWKTGTFIGTKNSNRLKEYEIKLIGEKRWKKQKKVGRVLLPLLAVVCFIAAFSIDFPTGYDNGGMSLVSYIGAFIGTNLAVGTHAYRFDR
ncbi:hypothetical protein [Thalassobacillus sp. CUG 92003]|uniref:hypothetical protein n=1 Tax=Thalassobacillus sp. CUG 92003 TaxID=2736641 RepID=UPI0015E77307|nr:hypothetical protein [Thalassobacillus sp. CUG 92003]